MRLILEAATRRGIAEVHYLNNPEERGRTDEEEAAIQAAAEVVTEMMVTGRGDEVLKFAAYISTPDSERSKSNTLAEALAKLPGSSKAEAELPLLVDDDNPPPPTPEGTVISIGKQRKS